MSQPCHSRCLEYLLLFKLFLRKEDLLIKIFYLKKGTEKETDMEFLFFKVFKIELSSHLDNNLLLFDYILVWLLACSKRL